MSKHPLLANNDTMFTIHGVTIVSVRPCQVSTKTRSGLPTGQLNSTLRLPLVGAYALWLVGLRQERIPDPPIDQPE
eukprot:scaffold62739_cov45-Prasinocladus_malaysianus.AAC.1